MILNFFSEERLYPFGPSLSEQIYEKGDEGYLLVYLKSPIHFMDKFYRKIYVSIKHTMFYTDRRAMNTSKIYNLMFEIY